MARHDLFKNPVSNWFLRSLGGIPFNRQRPIESRQALQAIRGFLNRGEGLVVFPEGTYYRNIVGPGRAGIVRFIISHVSLPFFPVGIQYRAKKRARTVVTIRFGKARYAGSEGSVRPFLNAVMKDITGLSGL